MNTENREHRSSTPPPLLLLFYLLLLLFDHQPRFSKLRRVPRGIASIYIRILTRWFDFPRKNVDGETARVWKSRTVVYPAVDLTFYRKLRPHCMPDCASTCGALENSNGNNLLRGRGFFTSDNKTAAPDAYLLVHSSDVYKYYHYC